MHVKRILQNPKNQKTRTKQNQISKKQAPQTHWELSFVICLFFEFCLLCFAYYFAATGPGPAARRNMSMKVGSAVNARA